MKKTELEKIAEELGMEAGNHRDFMIPWHQKIALKFFPRLFLRMSANKMGLDGKKIGLADNLFSGSKILIEPLGGGSRGFIIFIDGKLSLWFFQNGNHFEFDGVEVGDYEDADVTVFDNIGRK